MRIVSALLSTLIASVFFPPVLLKLNPYWLSKAVHKIDKDTLAAIIAKELPQTTASVSGPQKSPLVELVYFLTNVHLTNSTSLLGSTIPGILTNLQNNQVLPPPTPGDNGTQPVLTNSAPGNENHPVAADPASVLKPIVYIYHTHSWESFLPELGKNYLTQDMAIDRKINITLVGHHLTDHLNKANIPTVQTAVDYWSGGYNEAFNNSRKTAVEELKKYPTINVVFDIHRDDGTRELTTTTYQGKSYARIFWIIGGSNPNWKSNAQFAQSLSDEFDRLYPTDSGKAAINRGVQKQFYPAGSEYNSLFNQECFD